LNRKLDVRLLTAGLCFMLATTIAAAQTPPAQQSYSLEDRRFVGSCAALYRWQAGPQDPAYLKVKAFWDKIGGMSSKTQDVVAFVKRDAIQESVAAGRFKLASSLKNCTDTLGVAPASAPRTSAFPEEPDPAVVSAMGSCLALQRWAVGTDTFETRDSLSTYAAYARTTEQAAAAKAKEGMDNLDKAVDGGLDPAALMVAKEPCLQDYHIIILGEPDQRHSLEWTKAHPQVASSTPAPAAPSRPALTPLPAPDCDDTTLAVRRRMDPLLNEVKFFGLNASDPNAAFHMDAACRAMLRELAKSEVKACPALLSEIAETQRNVLCKPAYEYRN
jgi:hypothetical protein